VPGLSGSRPPSSLAFVQRLGELGFAEGKNLSITCRHAAGKVESFPRVAAELVTLNSDVLFSAGAEAALVALKRASRSTPIVFIAVDFDPVTTGHVANMAHPGGLITGVTAVQSVLAGKPLELLGELLRASHSTTRPDSPRPCAPMPKRYSSLGRPFSCQPDAGSRAWR